ncbi:MAG: hypothetical protein QM734_12025 [Cyclobacteriaceae bacterium]
MKNKLGALMIVAILAMTFSCGSKKSEGSEASADSTAVKSDSAVVKVDSTAKAAQDTAKAK